MGDVGRPFFSRGKKIAAGILAVLAPAVALILLGGGMTELEHEIFIRAPTEKVWAVLADLEAVKHYNPGMAQARYISAQREGVGAARECRLKSQELLKERVIGWEPGTALTMELYESRWPVENMQWRTEISPAEGGSLVRQKLQYKPKGFIGGVMNLLVMRRMINNGVGQVFEKLKSHIEGQ